MPAPIAIVRVSDVPLTSMAPAQMTVNAGATTADNTVVFDTSSAVINISNQLQPGMPLVLTDLSVANVQSGHRFTLVWNVPGSLLRVDDGIIITRTGSSQLYYDRGVVELLFVDGSWYQVN
jgi:hypothetical protein